MFNTHDIQQGFTAIQLHLNVPRALSDEVLDHLRLIPAFVSGCYVVDVAGFGANTQLLSAIERVQGLSQRRLIVLEIASAHTNAVMQHLKDAFAEAHIHVTALPVLGVATLRDIDCATTKEQPE